MQITYSITGSADASFINDLNAAIQILDSTFTNNVTINIKVGEGVDAQTGQTLSDQNVSKGGPSFIYSLGYSSLRADLINSDPEFFTSNSLPNLSSVNGVSTFNVSQAQAKMFGIPGVGTGPDGYVSIGTLFSAGPERIGAMLHEITHALGREPDNFTANGNTYDSAFDLFRFFSNGNRDFDGNPPPVAAAYFSLDGGATKLANFGVSSDTSDFLNDNLTPNDAFDEFLSPATNGQLTPLDDEMMEALGFYIASAHPLAPQNANDLSYSSTASGPNHFIDLPNFEASYRDLIAAFGTNQTAMQNWYNLREPIENRVETFDGLDYVASYRDLTNAFGAAGSMKAVQDDGAFHYIEFGQNEGRTTTFDGLDYIASYADLIKAFGANNDAGAFHYIEFGQNEGRTTTFDGLSYIAQYTDLMNVFGANNDAGAAHYIADGRNEGRSASFNVAAYESAHPDLIGKFASNDQFLTAYINTYKTTGIFLT
jgi:hypothetical protein